MITTRILSCLAAVCAATIVAGCGGSGGNSSTATPGATGVSPAAMAGSQHGAMGKPLGQAAPVPAGLQCTGDVVVWVNLKSKAYHEAADPYFGRTKNGKYLCKADADTAGYHEAGAMRSRRHSPEPAATASGY